METKTTRSLTMADMPRVIDGFYAGGSHQMIANVLGVTRNAVGGGLSRAGVVRTIAADMAACQFDLAASRLVRSGMEAGEDPQRIADRLHKDVAAVERHARALGFDVARDFSRAARDKTATPPPPLVSTANLETTALLSKNHDAEHVARCMAAGGFDRYDFASGWTVAHDGRRKAPFTEAAKVAFLASKAAA